MYRYKSPEMNAWRVGESEAPEWVTITASLEGAVVVLNAGVKIVVDDGSWIVLEGDTIRIYSDEAFQEKFESV